MSWAKFDDRATSNPKVKLLGDVAFRLWVSSICHCCEHLTDGQIDREIPAILPRAPSGAKLKAAIAELVSRGLWEEVEGGWEVHDFHDWNPSSDQVRAKKQARSEAGRRGGQNRGKATSKPEAIASPVAKQTEEQTESKIEPRPRPRPRPRPEAEAAEADLGPPTSHHQPPPGLQQQRPPSNLEAALKLPVMERSRLLLENEHVFQWVEPHRWPELQNLGSSIAKAAGWHEPRWSQSTGKAVRVLVSLLAEFSTDELRAFVAAIRDDEWIRADGRGFTSLSDEVVRRCLPRSATEAPDVDAGARERSRVAQETDYSMRARERLLGAAQ